MDYTAFNAVMLAHAPMTDMGRAEWDARFNEYLRCFALADADMEFGAYRRANNIHDAAMRDLEAEYGVNHASDPVAISKKRQAFDRVCAAEKAQLDDFLKPLWEAARRLTMTPAPDLSAALLKIEIVKREELDNDADFIGNPFDYVASDMARLGDAA